MKNLLGPILLLLCVALIQSRGIAETGKEDAYTNRLIHEKSPYLLQHAHNPVDWYPWGEEAFEKAKKENKPIFLSVGYSTCHWCHVMEEESFSDPEIAKIMNENFVSIKVDREERPDVDSLYMQFVMAMTGSGGWPMTVFLTPDLNPFFGGTYFPPRDRWGSAGLIRIMNGVAQEWKLNKKDVLNSGESVANALRTAARTAATVNQTLDIQTLKKAFEQFNSYYDERFGGFGQAPKFPGGQALSFLLRYWKRTGDPKALEMVEKTLQEMAKSGIYDHLGGGFHRYALDRQWRIPHFEKMLYDQALLAKSYLEAYQATGNQDYAQIARGIFDYVLRDMRGTAGVFYSAEDADSAPDSSQPEEKSEGAFYLWTYEEINEALGVDRAEIFNFYYGVEPGGNTPSDPKGEFKGKNILYVAHSLDETAKNFKKSSKQIEKILEESRKVLFELQSKRLRPHLDDKVLTDWNGLMISSLAFGSRVLNEPRYKDAARKAADFLLKTMKRNDGRLMHRYREGEVAVKGFVDDYAFFALGLYDLYEATFDSKYLAESKFFLEEMFGLFWDKSNGGFFFTAEDSEKLIVRTKEFNDSSIPSGNSVAILSLFRVARLTMDQDMENSAGSILDVFSSSIDPIPSAYPQMLIALDFVLGPSREIVIAGDETDPGTQAMIRAVYEEFLPNQVVMLHPSEIAKAKEIEVLSPFIKRQIMIEGKPTAYVCKNYICNFPTTDVEKFKESLKNK